VELRIFGCCCGDGLRNFPKSLMRRIRQVVDMKYEVKFVCAKFERMVDVP
jgi:hypothetical protein